MIIDWIARKERSKMITTPASFIPSPIAIVGMGMSGESIKKLLQFMGYKADRLFTFDDKAILIKEHGKIIDKKEFSGFQEKKQERFIIINDAAEYSLQIGFDIVYRGKTKLQGFCLEEICFFLCVLFVIV